MTGPTVDLQLLSRFEAGLDPRRPEHGAVPARVLDYGNLSTVMTIGGKGAPALVYKRLPFFLTGDEAGQFERSARPVREDAGRAGRACGWRPRRQCTCRMPPGVASSCTSSRNSSRTIASATWRRTECRPQTLGGSSWPSSRRRPGSLTSIEATRATWKWASTAKWATGRWSGYDAERGGLPERFRLAYLDTNTPMMRRRGQEQLDTEPFLRGCAIIPAAPDPAHGPSRDPRALLRLPPGCDPPDQPVFR